MAATDECSCEGSSSKKVKPSGRNRTHSVPWAVPDLSAFILPASSLLVARWNKEEDGLEDVTKVTGHEKAPVPRWNLATLRPAIPRNTRGHLIHKLCRKRALSTFPTSSYRSKMIEYSWDGRDCLCLESSPTMARAGMEGVGFGDQYPGQFAIHWGTLVRRLCFKGGGEESRGVRKGTVAWEYSASLAV